MLRFKNDLLPVEGIDVAFDGHAHDEDDYEIAILDLESYVIGVSLPDCSRVPSFFGYLNNCQTVPTVDWDYVQELYERDVEEQLQDSGSDMTVAEFEEHVRQLFRNSLTAHLSESDDDEEDDD